MISFFNEDSNFQLKQKNKYKRWIKEVVASLNPLIKIGDINVLFCSDEYILNINNQYLKHNYYTDIITFDYTTDALLSGDLVISIDTVKFNSNKYSVDFEQELRRVIIHGILHLLKFNDSTKQEQQVMREQEERALMLFIN